MSSRSIRKILGDPTDDVINSSYNEEVSEEEVEIPFKAFNPFYILNDDNDAEEEEEVEKNAVEEVVIEKKQTRRNQKKKKKTNQKKSPDRNEKEEDLNELLKQMNIEIKETPDAEDMTTHILTLNTSYLKPEFEMKKIYGASVLKDDKKSKKLAQSTKRFHFEVDRQWPAILYDNIPISFKKVGVVDDLPCFKCHRGGQYELAQKLFLQAYNSGNIELLETNLLNYPYHLDTLLEFSDSLRVFSQEQDLALDLLIRIIHKFEFSFDTDFNPLKKRCQLPYEFKENRIFFLAFMAYISSLGLKGCPRTALEVSKFLLSLDKTDPLGVIYLIDHFAIRSDEYTFLLNFYYSEEYGSTISNLPNYMFHIALASFLLRQNDGLPKDQDSSSELLEKAFIYFPCFLYYFSKALTTIKKDALNHPFFSNALKEPAHTKHIKLHAEVFMERNNYLWKDQSVIDWINNCVSNLVVKIDQSDEKVLEMIKSFEEIKQDFNDPPSKNLMISTHLTIPKANTLVTHDMFPEGLNVYDAIL